MRFLVVLNLTCWAAVIAAQTPYPPITYHLAPVQGIKALRTRYSSQELIILQKLNRRDLDHLLRLKEMVVPDQWYYNELAYSPLPDTWSWAEQYPKAIIVHQPDQVFGAYENGRLVRWGPVSTGRKAAPTPTGLYNLKWKAKVHISTDNDEWRLPWYFNFINFRGLGFHQYELPGYPASHACIRLLEGDALWIYGWGEQWTLDAKRETLVQLGTPVLILGQYDFNAQPPWRSIEYLIHRIVLPAIPDTQRIIPFNPQKP
jgi:hypothetical protein